MQVEHKDVGFSGSRSSPQEIQKIQQPWAITGWRYFHAADSAWEVGNSSMRKRQWFKRTPTSWGWLRYLNIAVHCKGKTIVTRVALQRQTESTLLISVVMGVVCIYDSWQICLSTVNLFEYLKCSFQLMHSLVMRSVKGNQAHYFYSCLSTCIFHIKRHEDAALQPSLLSGTEEYSCF